MSYHAEPDAHARRMAVAALPEGITARQFRALARESYTSGISSRTQWRREVCARVCTLRVDRLATRKPGMGGIFAYLRRERAKLGLESTSWLG